MGIHQTPTNIHWNYFLAIESDLEKTARYIEFTTDNYEAYSIEFASIIMSATQEVDGIMKKICHHLTQGESTPKKIIHYKPILQANIPEFFQEPVQIPRFGMESKPWVTWETQDSPEWWSANNKIKHERAENLKEACLKNAFNAVGALYITNLYFLRLFFTESNESEFDWIPLYHKLIPKNSLYIKDFDYLHANMMYASKGAW